jgi:hypothetical protein
MLLLALLALLVPTLLLAFTVNVYAVSGVNPDTVIGLLEPVAVILPGLLVAVYDVMAVPPLLAGAVNATVAVALPVAVAVSIVGAPGTVAAYVVMLLLTALGLLIPRPLIAVIVNV